MFRERPLSRLSIVIIVIKDYLKCIKNNIYIMNDLQIILCAT